MKVGEQTTRTRRLVRRLWWLFALLAIWHWRTHTSTGPAFGGQVREFTAKTVDRVEHGPLSRINCIT